MTTLKGYVRKDDGGNYVWVSEESACETCKDLEGEEYNAKNEAPDKPHPNCKCRVEKIGVSKENEDLNNKNTPNKEKKPSEVSPRDKLKDILIKLKKRQQLKENLKTILKNNKEYRDKISELSRARVAKAAVDGGMGGLNILHQNRIYDAKELWKIASHNFSKSENYITQNGIVVPNLASFPNKDLRAIIKDKLIEQLGVDDAPGMVFTPNSNLSQEIMYSKEFEKHIKKNLPELIRGNVIEKSSTYFGSNDNLRLALGHADILYTRLDKYGNLFSFILDTYDFNKDDPDWKVQEAYRAQKAGLIRNYYTVNVIFIPNYLLGRFFQP